MILVDSSVWIDYFNGRSTWQTDALDDLLSDVPVIMGDLILAEILQGFRSDKDFESAKSYLSDLPFRPNNVHLPSANPKYMAHPQIFASGTKSNIQEGAKKNGLHIVKSRTLSSFA